MNNDGFVQNFTASERLAGGARRCGTCGMQKGSSDFVLSANHCDPCAEERQKLRLLRERDALVARRKREADKIIPFPVPIQHPTSEVA